MSLHIERYDIVDIFNVLSLYREFASGQTTLPPDGLLARLDGELIGMATVFKYEGLPQFTAVEGGILPPFRRRGYGTQLLTAVVEQLVAPGQEMCVLIEKWDSPGGHFLRHLGFTLEHEELIYERPADTPLPPLVIPDGFHIESPRTNANYTFSGLYRQSFAPHAWYQPFNATSLPGQLPGLLVLYHGQHSVGFAWTRQAEAGVGQVEPFGIIPEYQKQGHGRVLLNAALHHLQQKDLHTLRIITWAQNTPARRLYEGLGFTAVDSQYYLSCKL
ncbi:MAG: GNAT family N-acetyltransferase [Anaerolineales bacterium]|nr:GNAT family N-acetyltransferase [Anaerolineales bacterium]